MSSIYKIIVFLLTLFVVVNLSLIRQYTGEEKVIIIPKNCYIKCIANILEKEEILKNKFFFLTYSYILNTLKKPLLAGEYSIKQGESLFFLIKKFTNGIVIKHSVTIPEGLTNKEIFSIIKKSHGIDYDINENYQEGQFFPDTYQYIYATKASLILQKMTTKMQKISSKLWQEKKDNYYFDNVEDAIILASIIEKETNFDDEKPIIASVYINRIKKNMPLQADPTVIYALGENFKGKLYHKDLKIDSPHNTYKKIGLPKTPICNPGIKSLIAALNPKQTPYLFFVANSEGKHVFSRNFDNHLKNIKKYRK